ncbi:uncharacterized protein TrAtP1_005324 [Trichoderma atroviride]|uniref:uncharacterized protein n=1 Tax=Hypocrea atroviridis TaxID=63577 RepID=UPI00331EAD09|nr:hypothetical protein TrAtP1_005324 [Trichoderma atroviride]
MRGPDDIYCTSYKHSAVISNTHCNPDRKKGLVNQASLSLPISTRPTTYTSSYDDGQTASSSALAAHHPQLDCSHR